MSITLGAEPEIDVGTFTLNEECNSAKPKSGCVLNHRCAKPGIDDSKKQALLDVYSEVCKRSEDCGKVKDLAGEEVTVKCSGLMTIVSNISVVLVIL